MADSADYSTCKFNVQEPKVIWELTNACNYTCNYCVFASTPRIPAGELSFEKICAVSEDLAQNGFNYIKFTGGEPFLRPDLLDILRHVKSLGMRFDLSTNASLITPELAKELKSCGPSFVHVSLDGSNAYEHEAVRGHSTFESTITGLRLLVEEGLAVRVGSVVHSKNQNNLKGIIELAHSCGATEVVFSLLEPAGRQSSKNLPTAATTDVLSQLQGDWPLKVSNNFSHKKSGKPSAQTCPAGSRFLFINSVGDVLPCTWLAQQDLAGAQDNLNNRSISDILNSAAYATLRKNALRNPGLCLAEHPQVLSSYFSKMYLFATENLQALRDLHLEENAHSTALTTTGSFDQALTLAQKGFDSIHCVDINPLAKYFAELKLAALGHLNHSQFMAFYLGPTSCFNFKTYQLLEKYLSASAAQFWRSQYVKYHYFGINLKKSELFRDRFDYDPTAYIKNSGYLQTVEAFNDLRDRVKEVKFSFETADVLEGYAAGGSYDLIYLSNVADYAHKKWNNSSNYVELFKTNCLDVLWPALNSGGVLIAAYIYDATNKLYSDLRSSVNDEQARRYYWGRIEGAYEEHVCESALPQGDLDSICVLRKITRSYT